MGAGNFQLQGANLDHLGNMVYPSVDRATIIEKDNFDERHRALLGSVREESGNYTVLRTDSLIICDPPVLGQTITLPAISEDQWRFDIKKKHDAGLGVVTIAATGADTIEGFATAIIPTAGSNLTFMADNAAKVWRVI